MAKKKAIQPLQYVMAYLRIALGSIFLWAFVDKLLGLGFTTCRAEDSVVEYMCKSAWIEGGSPTTGFLKFATDGPMADFYQGLAGNTLVDWLFMLGLLGIGAALMLGVGMRIAVMSGSLLLLMMWSAVLPPEHHPVVDDHLVYVGVLWALLYTNQDQVMGYGRAWSQTALVKKYPILR
jgi:thiosulfate dehydrogenase [quinone] large subunit